MVVLEQKQNRNHPDTELLMSLKTSQLYLDQIEEITQQARTAEGRALVIKMLIRKLGDLSPESTTKVGELSLDRLEALGEDLLDFQVVSDLENWLG
jgi:heme oxygenase